VIGLASVTVDSVTVVEYVSAQNCVAGFGEAIGSDRGKWRLRRLHQNAPAAASVIIHLLDFILRPWRAQPGQLPTYS